MIGLNVVGLRRRGFKRDVMDEIKRVFRALNVPVGNLREIAAHILQRGTFASPEARAFLEFFQGGRRGFARVRRGAADDEADGND